MSNTNNHKLLFLFTFFCFILSIFRVWICDTYYYLFLIWNLFLAGIPYVISSLALKVNPQKRKGWLIIPIVALWLLFFPNAPYILTDLLHIKGKSQMPGWYDLILTLSYGWTGLMYGYLSLVNIELLFPSNQSIIKKRAAIIVLLFISSIGVFMGRYLRWNSWDMVLYPKEIVAEVLPFFTNPFSHANEWMLIMILGLFLNMVYWSLRFQILGSSASGGVQ